MNAPTPTPGHVLEPTVGQVYRVVHPRKGRFTARVVGVYEEWIDLEIVSGRASAMCAYNERTAGESVRVRTAWCTFSEAAP